MSAVLSFLNCKADIFISVRELRVKKKPAYTFCFGFVGIIFVCVDGKSFNKKYVQHQQISPFLHNVIVTNLICILVFDCVL